MGVESAIHRKKLELIFKSFKSSEAPADGAAMPSGDTADASAILKKFAAFLSHFKQECGTEARLVQQNLKAIIEKAPLEGCGGRADIFLDSDDLSDLRHLLDHVRDTKCLVLLQSKGVLTRPWVIMELYTAITSGVPIVALNVQNANPYNYADAVEFLMHFDTHIEVANPGAAELLVDLGVEPEDVAYLLSDSLPNIISTDFNPNASEKVLQASLEDLADAMRKAKPIAPTMTKEEWLEKRKSHKPSLAAKAHGSSSSPPSSSSSSTSVAATSSSSAGAGASSSSGGGSASSASSLAEVPATVPELPGSYLVRDEDLSQLKAALLASKGGEAAGGSATALTSKTTAAKQKNKKQSNKVGAHGMGGVGKTTIAAALIHDEEIRGSFDSLLWVSLGQEPDIQELSDSIHHQLTKQHFADDVKSDADRLTALRDAAKSKDVLLVLDDVWDPTHEKPLNCINSDNASRLLVTTRIRGLLKNSAEVDVGVLSEGEALKLLISSAEMDEGDVEEGSEEERIAKDIVELCGRLPLTLVIAGGMISDNPDGFSDDVVEVMKEDRLREQDDEDESGVTLEERVISSSLKMIKGKNKDLVLSIFKFFAVFPEDVPVPAGFFTVCSPMLTGDKNEKKAKMTVGNCLGTLLKYNLIKGSLQSSATGHGVFMHDIVRDFVINKHSEEELRDLQKTVVATILAARPEPDGFPDLEFAPRATFEGYVARALYVHMKGAMEGGEEVPDAWITHKDKIVKANVGAAVGFDALCALSEQKEAVGDLVQAAQIAYAAFYYKGTSEAAIVDVLFRAADLLERADDRGVLELELEVLDACWPRYVCVCSSVILSNKSVSSFESHFLFALS
jgi:hypothetical protein